eukprot:CAMPEP_0179147238 /NCGR_PEP_ID=MMETSP0796-20121207/71167_1 /TAXON_ID=73915 /ORGANISM="Pyrodinium bahamense, Strain pbaha01" /LENGTH=89 /DNA_ID=CAMNT_0020847823 /DNA_START=32 /DNA_END=297 /DNA_ORIENTATION=+
MAPRRRALPRQLRRQCAVPASPLPAIVQPPAAGGHSLPAPARAAGLCVRARSRGPGTRTRGRAAGGLASTPVKSSKSASCRGPQDLCSS